jgi:hypothetical protein
MKVLVLLLPAPVSVSEEDLQGEVFPGDWERVISTKAPYFDNIGTIEREWFSCGKAFVILE